MYDNFFPNLSSIISEKCAVNPQFSFWILIALPKICFFHIVVNRAKILLYYGVNSLLKRPEYPEMRRTYAQKQ